MGDYSSLQSYNAMMTLTSESMFNSLCENQLTWKTWKCLD